MHPGPRWLSGRDREPRASRSQRAELATDEYLPLTSVVEGIVILKKNPEYVEPAPTK